MHETNCFFFIELVTHFTRKNRNNIETFLPLLPYVCVISATVQNNNMAATVVRGDIPAVNGWVHVIDRLLTVPYSSVAEVLASSPDMRSVCWSTGHNYVIVIYISALYVKKAVTAMRRSLKAFSSLNRLC